jgi:Sulfotransferase family
MDVLNRKPLYAFGEPKGQENSPILVLGSARGGTSMVAGVLAKLGIFLGEGAVSPVYESNELSGRLLGRSDRKAKSAVAELNANHASWAWKRPAAVYDLSRTMRRMQPNRVIMVFRDPMATASRRSMSVGDLQVSDFGGISEHLQMVLNEYSEMLALASGLKVPLAMVSYDTALRNPEEFVEQLVAFLGVSVKPEALASAIEFIKPSPTEYLMSVRAQYVNGVLDGVDEDSIWGWAKSQKGDPEGPVEVEILLNGERYASMLANQQRSDLTRAGYGDCAFRFELETSLPAGTEVRVRVVGDGLELMNSPLFFKG